jgi:hypothetical protein
MGFIWEEGWAAARYFLCSLYPNIQIQDFGLAGVAGRSIFEHHVLTGATCVNSNWRYSLSIRALEYRYQYFYTGFSIMRHA